MEQTSWQQRRDFLISVICIGIILWAVWNIAGQFVEAIVILLLSMAVAFLLTPLVNYLVRYKVPRVLAALVVYIVVLLVLSGLGYALMLSLINQILVFSNTIVNLASALPDRLNQLQLLLEKQANIPEANIQAAIAQIQGQATDFARTLAANTLGMLFLVTNILVNILLVVVLSFYLTLDGKRIRESIVSIVPKRSLPHVVMFENALTQVVGNYIRGQLTLAAIIGVLVGFVCAFWGLKDYALILAVLAFLFETIPMVGPALASIPALLLSLLLPDPMPRTVYIAISFLVIQMIESNVLGPRIVGRAVGLHPVASILALLVGAKLFGAFGALLATPIVAAAWVVIASIYRSARGETVDQIMARKPPPWTMRRPNGLSLRGGRRRTSSFNDHPPHGAEQKEYEEYEVQQKRTVPLEKGKE